jgi:hypothetical protein
MENALPSLVIQIQNGQDMHMDSAFPMELLVLEVELLLTKRMEKPNVVTSDCQSAMNLVKQSMREAFLGYIAAAKPTSQTRASTSSPYRTSPKGQIPMVG